MYKPSRPVRVFFKLIDFCFDRNNGNKRRVSGLGPEPAPELFGPSVVLYDRACPICRAEMQRLKSLDRHEKLHLLDITGEEFKQEAWGVSRSEASAALHVYTADEEWLVGMSAIRHVYAQVGLGWLMAPSGWPLVSPLADLAYRYIAPNRFVISRWLGLGQAAQACHDEVCNSSTDKAGG